MYYIKKRATFKVCLILIFLISIYWVLFLAHNVILTKQFFLESFSFSYQAQRQDSDSVLRNELKKELLKREGVQINLPPIENANFENKDFYKSLVDARLIFVGGYARSGTTLMRAILDVHKAIYCGPETKVVPTILDFFTKYRTRPQNIRDLQHAGINTTQLNMALASFIYSIMENHGERVPRLCAKDPDVLYYMNYLNELFPRAKFVYMVRDGRAAAYSLLDRLKEQKTFTRYKPYLTTWNNYNRLVYAQCKRLGKEVCHVVIYEQLILHPKETIQKVMQFLGEEFSEDLLNHHKYIGDRVKVSQTEWSTDQIMKPINTKSLTTWIDNLVEGYDSTRIKYIMPMLTTFNYSFEIDSLDYRKEVADAIVVENTQKLKV